VTGGESYWIASAASPGYAALDGELTIDVAVVGGGIAGLTTALLLKQAGMSVAVLEATEVGAGVTGHTTGKLTAGHGLAYTQLESRHGEEAAQTYAASQTASIELVMRLVEKLGIECELEHAANYVYAETDDEIALLETEVAVARRAGLPVELMRGPATPFPALAAIRLDGQAQLHARKYVLGLARAVHGDSCAVYEQSRVLELEPGLPMRLQTELGTVLAKHVVLATNAPITFKGLFFARAHARRAYVVAARVASDPVEGMWINVGSPTRSVRAASLEGGGQLVLVVGEGHRVGQDDGSDRYGALESFLARHFDGARPAYRWSTQDQYSVDGVPYVGRLGDETSRLYVATGFGGWGLTNGSLSGLLVADAVLGRENPWSALYDPARSSLRRAPGTIVKENAIVARELVGGKLRSRPSSVDEVAAGTGEVLELYGERVAVYRDESGDVFAVSAACTHLGCVVAWNAAERSWDCPCHGSRFDIQGAVLNGPAMHPLEAVDVQERTGARRSGRERDAA
jgi:glycine/D-amino acid oxidase-like deaminating enzyme/nitrite reductase/ring-hydroxylating ferredoxin subunit